MDENIVKPKVNPTSNPLPAPQPTVEEISVEPVAEEVVKEVSDDEDKGLTKNALEGHYMSDPLFHHVCRFLGIEAKDYHFEAPRVSALVDWAINETGTTDSSDVLLAIKMLERRVSVGLGEKKLSGLYRYVKLNEQKRDIEKQMRVYDRY